VNPTPVASFNAQMDTCTGTSLYNLISNTSQSNATDPSLTYLWTITNTTDASSTPITSTLAIPTDTLVNTDDTSHIYVLSLSVTNSYGCDSTTYDTLVVHPNAIAQIVTCPPAQCAPLTLTSNNLIGLHYPNANDVMSTYKWSILDSNGTLLTTQWGLNSLNYIINGSNQGVTLRLTAYSLYGCDSSSDSCSVYTLPNPDPGFTISPILCSNDLDSVLIVNDPLHYQKWTLTFNNSVVLGYPIFNQQPNFSTLSSSPGTYVLTHKVWLSADSTGCDSTTSQSFTIYTAPTPTIAFPGDSSACGAYTLLPTVGNQTSNFTSIQWRVNDPTINILNDTTTTPSISFPKSFNGISNYTIQLVVTDTNGCIDSTSRVFSVLPTPVAQFGLVSDTACSGVNLAQRITNLSTSNYPSDTTLTYQWTIINTSSSPIDTITSNTKVPVVSLINTGDTTHIYTITLRVLNAFSCDSTVSSVFKVHPNAKAQIDSCSAGGCAPFTVTSSNVVGHHYPYANDLTSTYKWTILDANNNVLGVQIGLNALNYTIQASNSSIKLRLTAYSLYGCDSAMDSCNVFTQGNPDPGFTLVDSAGCSPFQPTILAGSILTGIHTWIIVDAQGDTIQLATTNDTIRPNFTPIANLNTGTSQSYTLYHTIGASGCDSTTSLLFTVFEQLTAQIQHNAPICSDSILSANDVTTGQIQSRFWTLVSSAGDTLNSRLSSLSAQSVSITFPNLQYPTSDSLYYLYLTNVSIDSCTAIDVDTLTIHARPLAKFGVPSDSCGVFALAPVDSSGSNSSITNWSWSISPSTGVNILDPTTQTPTFNLPKSFNGVQNYRIYLTVTDSNGCQDTTSRVFQVNPTPVASFALSTDSICTGTSLASILSNVSVTNDPADTTLTYLWSILNTSVSASTPLTSGLKVPTNTLVNTDTISHIYTLTLTVTNSFGCDSTIQLPLVVHPNAIAQIDSISLADCAPFTISNLNAKAVAFNNANSAYIWTILDSAGTTVLAGPSNTGINGLSYTINASNTYITIQLQAVSLFGCDTATTQVVALTNPNPDPTWALVDSVGCGFTPTLGSLWQSTGTHTWVIADPQGDTVWTSVGNAPAFPPLGNTSYVNDSTYIIYHTAGTNGCDSTMSIPVTVFPTPYAGFSVPDSCAPFTVSPVDSSQGKNITYQWTLFNPSGSVNTAYISNTTLATPTLTFPDLQYPAADSTYTLRLVVTSSNSCVDSLDRTLTIHARPLAKFGVPSDSCGVFALAPVDSSGSNSSITNWSWSISPSTGVNILDPTTQTPTFNLPKSFNGVQNYRIYLTVTDSNGCQDTTSRVFQVNPTPVASFALSTDSICTGTSLASILSNVSVTNDPADTTLTYLWSILNTSVSASTPLTSGLKVPTNTLVNTDTISHIYTLTLTVTNSFGCDSTIQLPLVVHPNAIAQIDSISLADCAPFTISNLNAKAVAFNNANSAYIWTILDSAGTTVLAGPSNTGINGLSYTINASNTYITIQLQAVSLFGCDTATTQVVARSYENPDPDWTFVQDTGCHVFTPAFANVNQTTGTHRWRIFDANNTQIGSTLSGASPALPSLISTNLTGLTVYTIEHHSFVSDTNSCDSVLIKNIYIKPNPIPTIVALPDTNCANETITFTGQSQNPSIISTWEWGINGITLYGTSVSYTFTSPGVYPLYLKTYTQDGCDTIVRDTITIHSYPYVDFQTLSSCGLDTVCVNQVFNLQNFSTSDSLGGTLTTYLWDILNDGTYEYTSLNPSHTFTAIGSYPIRLRVVNEFGCFTDTLHTIFVNSAPIATISFQDSSICGPVVPIFTEGGSGIIDSTHYELYAFNNAGSKVTLASWANTTPVLPPLVPNYYNDTLYVISKANFNCCGFSIDYDSIYIKTPPVANWSVFPDSGCTPVQIIFQLDGFVHGNADSAFIDFGDGSSQSFLANKVFTGSGYQYLWGQKSHVYTYSGFNDTIFIATLNVYNECGDSSISAPIYVQPNTVQASLQANKLSGCAPLTVQFTNTSYNATNVGWYFNWDPSSGTGSMTSNLNNPQWTFTTPGSYLVALAVDNGCGFDTAYTTITVDPSPTASFTYPSSICQGDTALFISTSSISNGNIVGYLWDFGDGDTSILQNPSHIFNASGSFDVTLIVTSYNGCQDSITHPVLVLPQPLIGFSYNDTCLTDTTYFLNLSTIPSGGFAGIFWDFGDGNVSNQWSPKHVYQAAGTYTVTLQLVSDSGCVSALAQDVDVYPLPNLSFAPLLTAGDSCSVPQTYTFNNTSTNTQQYLWDFDYVGNPGINTSTLTSPSFTYTTAGVYTVMLVGETGYGCRDTIFRNLLIRDGVIAQFLQSPVAGCQPLEVTFKDTSIYTASLDTILSITWDFGDGTSITLTDTPWVYTHTYVQYGTYFPTQTVTMASGCSDIIVGQMVQVYPTPVAGFSIQKVNLNTRQFLNQSITVDTAISYYWTFGDGSWSTEENPVHEYDPNIIGLDSIKICLRVTNSYGCVDSTCTTIWIWPPNLDVPNALAPGLNYVGEDAIFLPKGHSLGQYELEIFDVWGNVVFRTTELDSDGKPSEGWDGRDMRTGNPCAMGVYAWRIRAVFDNGERWVGRTDAYGGCSECGTLTLLR
jgi:PKD repeat protein